MDALNSLYTAGSALTAQRLRLDVVSSNLANAGTTVTQQGGPYKRELVVFEPRPQVNGVGRQAGTAGVQVAGIVEDKSPPNKVFEPGSPQADQNGFVSYPNVDITMEMIDLMSASRAYQASASVIQTTKTEIQTTLDLGRV